MNPVVTLTDVTKSYTGNRANNTVAVCNANLTVMPGEFLVITGRSGSGKTTLLNLIGGLTRPTSGEVLLDGINLWTLPDKQQSLIRNQKVGFIFQFASLLASLTALENVMLPLMFGPNHLRQNARERAAGRLEDVGLGDKLHSYPRELSAGQEKRVAIARSLICHPEVLLADEATSNLDEQTEREILDLLKAVHQTSGVTVLMVTHSQELVRYGTRSLEILAGRITDTTNRSISRP
jgi:ABC-type lipoprotein export system ATPase subunit